MLSRKGRFRRRYPEPVKRRFLQLREDLPFRVTLVESSGHFYVYRLDVDDAGKRIKRGKCIGRILGAGQFVPSRMGMESDLDLARAVILAHGGKVSMPREEQKTFDYSGIQLTESEERILTCLSMNARLTAPELARIAGMKAQHVASRRRSLEQALGIGYVADIRLDPLGYSQFLITVKFFGERPNPELLKEQLSGKPSVLFAAFCSGEYDMMMIIAVRDNREASTLTRELRSLPSLSGLGSRWFVSTFFATQGNIPVRQEFFSELEKRVWRRAKGRLKPDSNQLTRNEFMFMRELNADASAPLVELERKAGIPRGSGRYILERLQRRGIVRGVTITMSRPSVRYDAAILLSVTNEASFLEGRASLLEAIVKEHEGYIMNRFSMVGDITTPNGVLLMMPVLGSGDMESVVNRLESGIRGIEVETLVLSQVLVGSQLHRRFDNAYSRQCEVLATFYKKQEYISMINSRPNYMLVGPEE